MNKPTTLTASVFGLLALLVIGSLALAAGPKLPIPTAPGAANVPMRSGLVDFVDTSKGVVVIDDRQYLITDKLTVNGKSSGARFNLHKGMRVTFSYGAENGHLVINDVRTGQ